MEKRRRRRSSLNFGKTRRKFNAERFRYIATWIVEIVAVIVLAFVLFVVILFLF